MKLSPHDDYIPIKDDLALLLYEDYKENPRYKHTYIHTSRHGYMKQSLGTNIHFWCSNSHILLNKYSDICLLTLKILQQQQMISKSVKVHVWLSFT